MFDVDSFALVGLISVGLGVHVVEPMESRLVATGTKNFAACIDALVWFFSEGVYYGWSFICAKFASC